MTSSLMNRNLEYLQLFIDICSNRRFFVTRKGSFGIGSAETEAGDHICVLEGSKVPYVLRIPRKDDEKAWQIDFDKNCTFVGEAVVQGYMYATEESLQEDEEAGRIQIRDISII